mmetsp:Transcript_22934/g.68709  ORF Transcript_22934/g.68709 Transcript_22934/m.68709 type:complete len:257 (-) Transcript_22934:1195-1965(-)
MHELQLILAVLVREPVVLGILDDQFHFPLLYVRHAVDGDLPLLPSRPVLRGDGEDAVDVNLEGHLDLGDARRRRRDALKPEGLELLVVRRQRPLALQHDHLDRVLRVLGRREEPGPLGRDGSVALDDRREDSTVGLDTQRQWCDIDEHDVLSLPHNHGRLDGRADGNDLVGVDSVVHRLELRQLPDQHLHRRDAARAADEHNLGHVLHLVAYIFQGLQDWLRETHHEVHAHLGELVTCQHLVDVLGPVLICRDEGD